MATFSDAPNPMPYQMPPATGPAGLPIAGGQKQTRIRGLANAAKQRSARQLANFRQFLTGAQHSNVSTAAATLVEKRDIIDKFVRKVIFG